MFRRIELHNHTVESDGKMTPEELAWFAVRRGFGAMALTDHNTTSGIAKLRAAVRRENLPLDLVPGTELTTYYGHILCLGVTAPVPWEDIDPSCADILFRRAHELGGCVGVAHAFALPRPISNGCAWAMRIRDISQLDFIEIVNEGSRRDDPRMQAFGWWKSLVLAGARVAATSGLDLHADRDITGCFTTWFEADGAGSVTEQLKRAIAGRRTAVTRGPLLLAERDGEFIRCRAAAEGPAPAAPLLAVTETPGGRTSQLWPEPAVPLAMAAAGSGPAVVSFYRDAELFAVAPPLP